MRDIMSGQLTEEEKIQKLWRMLYKLREEGRKIAVDLDYIKKRREEKENA